MFLLAQFLADKWGVCALLYLTAGYCWLNFVEIFNQIGIMAYSVGRVEEEI